ncbi:MAG: DUF5686 and carboxypeptidase regulatory-like domain-containing protein [Bacteroidales bacterium]|nr:DUF5686 and carboxypeptidase regulatory-like domain-containing protein [Bacteroidales bacterium]MCF8387406.1 DUF5686 and carboxypeptidase regulatory-like domain-containing protein [Bacteroidales bacterium]MCF8397315.1 DUF5686 and carboxypeptidase regulatory-like domain-containing protein [Bacteroidales bacterium]
MKTVTNSLRGVLLAVLILMAVINLQAQKTKIMGRVTNAVTGEAIPFANIIIKGSSVGATTNFEGEFSIETRDLKKDTLLATYIGYHPYKTKIRLNVFQEINIQLEPANILLDEVEILPGENPAEILLRKIIENKEENNKQNFEAYQYEVYNKIQLDINNITEKLKDRKLLKPFRFIFDYVDTSTVNGKVYLPAFLSESISEVYFRQQPKLRKEIIQASQVSGLENESITQFMGDLYQNINIYDNFIMIFEKNFVSPIASFGLSYYKYYLIDSSFIDEKWCYQVMFKPRRKQELTFTGEFWVHDTSFAIRKVNMEIARDANINFVNTIEIRQEYDKIQDEYWMLTRDYFVVDFNVIENTEKTIGLFGHKTASYDKFVFNQPMPERFKKTPLDVYVEEESDAYGPEFWELARHEDLTRKERAIYEMVDSIKRVPVFNTWVDAFYLFTNGYLIWGPLEVGPLYKALSFNPLEGTRLRIGGRTSNSFSTKILLEGHVAYGTKDERLKYGLGGLYMFDKNPRRALSGSFLYDMEQLGQSQNAFSEDNIFASILRRSPADKLSLVRQYKTAYEHEWFTGFSNSIGFLHRQIYPVGGAVFEVNEQNDPLQLKSITTSEIELGIRFAYREKFVMGEFERISLGTVYPVLEVKYGAGLPDFLDSRYEYQRLQFSVKDWFNVFSLGWSKYIIQGGKIFGTLPYPLLKLHAGNETFMFDEYAYNLMNYYEFVSDEYLSLYYTHHFDGLFLNRIPLMRKLNWREVAFVKGVIGTLSDKNKAYSKFPEGMYTLEKPYVEAGVGIENIIKIFRVDAIWRLSHLDNPDINKFALFFSFHFSF